jgi:hypothetical protein
MVAAKSRSKYLFEGPRLVEHKHQVSFWDRLGLSASVLCIFHCTLTPVLIFFLPLAGEWFKKPEVHMALAAVVFPVGLYAFFSGYGIHGNKKILALAIAGFSFLAIGLISEEFVVETFFTVIGGICLSIGHYLNLRSCRCGVHSH